MSKNILVVDDESGIRQILIGIIKKMQYQTAEASDGVEALKVLEPLVSSPSPFVRRIAVCLLGIMCGESSIKVIENAMNDNEVSVRQAAEHIVNALSNG